MYGTPRARKNIRCEKAKATLTTSLCVCLGSSEGSMGEQGSCARTSSGYVSSGSRGEGQGSKAGKEKGPGQGCVPAAGTGAGSYGALLRIVHLGDGGGHMSLSAPISHGPKPCPTGHQVPCTSSLHAWVLSVKEGVTATSSGKGQGDCKYLLRSGHRVSF